MQKKSFYYDFNGLRFTPFTNQIEVLETGKKIKLSQIHCLFLLALAENPQAVVTFDDLRQAIWLHEPTVDARLVRNIQSTKNNLVNVFKSIGADTDFIKPVPGKGYLLDANVAEETPNVNSENAESVLTAKMPISNSDNIDVYQSSPKNSFLGQHAVYVAVSSLLYGSLFWIALLLEVAYQFDRFGATALWLGFPLVLGIAATSFAGLTLTQNLVRQEKRRAFFVGLAFFVGGAISACLAVSYFLPNEPITAASFQTQPAFAAFLKNSLIYFLPLGVIFILIPFHFVCVQQTEMSKTSSLPGKADLSYSGKVAINLRPFFLFGLWLFAVASSIFSTFRLLDNLLPGQYHSLFVTLIFLRFFVYFSVGLVCLIWYNSQRLSNLLQN